MVTVLYFALTFVEDKVIVRLLFDVYDNGIMCRSQHFCVTIFIIPYY